MGDEETGLVEPGTVVGGRYRIERHLGKGGMGSVYEAANTVTEKRVALKLITPEQKENAEVKQRLMREARIAARVQHANIVDIYDVGVEGDSVFLVMELLQGSPLDEWLDERRPVQVMELMEIILQMLRGLAALHEAGVTHRDLKPGNVFVVQNKHEPRPHAKLLDFGIARDRGSETLTLTRPGQILGTPAYMAPEQLDAPDSVDSRTDVYACGVLLYEAFAGERPFRADSLTSLIAMVLKGNPEPLDTIRTDLPKELVHVIQRAMEVEPEDRYPDVGSLAAALAPFGPKEAWQGVETVPSEADSAGANRKVTWIAAAVATVVLVAVLASLDLSPEERSDEAEAPPAAALESGPPQTQEVYPEPEPAPDPVEQQEVMPPPTPLEPIPVDIEVPEDAEPSDDNPESEGEPHPPRPRVRPRPPDPPRDGLQLDPDDF